MLRPYQQAASDHAVEFLSTAPPGAKMLYAAPTGSGKSYVELDVQRRLPGSWIVSPRDEILQGMLEKLGVEGDPYDHSMCTPVRLRNKLVKGEGLPPKYLLFDEGHHQEAETWQQLDLLSGLAPAVGYTATPYRGSPRSTRDLLERWGEPLWIITYLEAEQMGVITMPSYTMLPLVDDDEVEVRNGEFVVESVESATLDRLEHLSQVARERWIFEGLWDRPTIFSFPSLRLCNRLAQLLPVLVVSADTPRAVRREAFKAVIDRTHALAHINIVTEGVDLPLRRLVDCSPVMSPVKFVQQLGRVTRPTDDRRPEYIATNRNLLRHAYALEGCVPFQAIAETEKVFRFSERSSGARVIGMEAIGRFKPARAKTSSGVTVDVYCVSCVQNDSIKEYAVLAHPALPPVWAKREHTKKADGTRDWGKWVKCPPPSSLRGFSSTSAQPITEKQRAWWLRSAKSRGLDDSVVPDKRSFAILPFLFDLDIVLR